MENKLYVSLDIGTSTTVALVGYENKDKQIEIIGSGLVPTPSEAVKDGAVLNIIAAAKSVRLAIEKAQNEAQTKIRGKEISIREVVVGLGGKCVHNIEISDYITREKSDKIIDAHDVQTLKKRIENTTTLSPNQNILAIIPKEFKVDDISTANPVGMIGARLEGLFIVKIVEKRATDFIQKTLEQLSPKIKVHSFVPTALASSLAVLTNEEKEAGVAVVDVGAGVCNVLIYSNKVIQHIAHHLFAGNAITSDIQQGTSVLMADAERLKVGYGIAYTPLVEKDDHLSALSIEVPGIKGAPNKDISVRNLSEIIEARCEEIIADFYQPIADFNESHKHALVHSVVLTGGGSHLQGFKELIEAQTGLSVRIGYPEYLSPNSKEQNDPQYAVAIGLIAAAIAQDENDAQLGIETGEVFVEQKRTTPEPPKAEEIPAEQPTAKPTPTPEKAPQQEKKKSLIQRITSRLNEFMDGID